MNEVSPDNEPNSPTLNTGAQTPVSPPGMAPAWEPAGQRPLPSEPVDTHMIEAARGLYLEQGGRSGMTDTAERIGSAVGSAQRQVRLGLELVRHLPASGAAHASQMEREMLDSAAGAMQELGKEVADLRHQAARRLDEWSEQADERFQQLRRQANGALPRARQLAGKYPLQTIAAFAGAGFALGVALRLGRRFRRG